MSLDFYKYQVAGNDIVVVDGRQQNYPRDPTFYQKMADRRYGVGFDQAMLALEPDAFDHFFASGKITHPTTSTTSNNNPTNSNHSDEVDLAYVVFNADGSISSQCGNGLCALAHCLGQTDGKTQYTWRGLTRIVKTVVRDANQVVADMGAPEFEPEALPYTGIYSDGGGMLQTRNGDQLRFYLVSMSNPHAIIFLSKEQEHLFGELELIGRGLNDSDNFPEGVNVSLVYPQTHNQALIRVYERGAGETLACGSASCAAIACARRWFKVQDQLTLTHPGGSLHVQWAGGTRPIFLHANVRCVYTGQLDETAFVEEKTYQ